jgi:hypothetical protein
MLARLQCMLESLYCPQDRGCGNVPNALRANRAYATRRMSSLLFGTRACDSVLLTSVKQLLLLRTGRPLLARSALGTCPQHLSWGRGIRSNISTRVVLCFLSALRVGSLILGCLYCPEYRGCRHVLNAQHVHRANALSKLCWPVKPRAHPVQWNLESRSVRSNKGAAGQLIN